MKNNLFKKSMSVFLSVLMIMSCWVFVPGEHNHAEAADATNYAKAVNTAEIAKLTGETTINTTSGVYFAGDTEKGITSVPNVYQNLLWSSSAQQAAIITNQTIQDSKDVEQFAIYYPTTVLMYDGSTTPQMGVSILKDSLNKSDSKYQVFHYGTKISSTTDLVIPGDWHTKNEETGSTNPKFYYTWTGGNNQAGLNYTGTKGSSYYAGGTGWHYMSNLIQYKGTLSDTTYSATYTPSFQTYLGRKWSSWGSSKSKEATYTLNCSVPIYVINVKPLKAAYTKMTELKNNITSNYGRYDTASVRKFVELANALTAANPNKYTWSTNTATQVSNYASAAKTAVDNWNTWINAGGLQERKFEVTYDNMFSLSDWWNSGSSNKDNVSVDLAAGEVTVKHPSDSGEWYTPVSDSDSNANTRNTTYYAMPVVGGREYTFKYTVSGTNTQMFAFFYDANGGCTHSGSDFGKYNFSYVSNTTAEKTFKAPDGSAYMEIRFDNDAPGTTAVFSDIMIYPAARATEVGLNDWATRPYRTLYDYNAAVGTLPTPVREGYKFDGWKEDTNGDGIGDASAPTGNITSSRVLYSSWTVDNFTLTFDAAGGNASATSLVYSPEGSVQMPTVTRDGYAFDGWKVTTAGGNWNAGDTYGAGQILTGKTGNATLTAQWKNVWTVTYYYGDNTATVQVKDGETVGTLPTVTPTKEKTDTHHYTFAEKWQANGAEFTENTKVTSDLKVYPVFNEVPHTFVWADNPHKSATCDAPALVHKYCSASGCGYSLGNVPYDGDNPNWLAKGHDYTGDAIKIEGNDDQHAVKCVRYGKDGCTATKLFDHTWTGDTSVGATCTIPGTVKKTCPCGAEKYVEGALDTTNHVNTKLVGVVAPKCDTDGFTGDLVCADCGVTIAFGKTDPKLGHLFTKYYTDGNATCTADGTETAHCERCAATDTRTVEGSKLEHTFTNYVYNNDAKCGVDGTKTAECDTCETDATHTITAEGTALEHKFNGEIKNNNDGTHSYKCTNEDCEVYGGTIDCTYGEWDTKDSSQHIKTCEDCGYKLKENHKFSAWATTDEYKQADGQHSRTCLVCHKEVIKDCTYTRTEHAETCTADGYIVHSCNDCGHKYQTVATGKIGHDYSGEIKSYNNGQHNYLCVNGCGTYGYSGVENARVNCSFDYENTADGSHKATCAYCKYSTTEACSGGQATCTAKAECTKCNTVYGETVPHTFKGTVVKLDGDKHAYLCEFCSTEGLYGVGAEKDATEACSGGKATCKELAVCDKCNDTYGDYAAHVFNGLAIQLDNDVHAFRCSVCKDDSLYGVGSEVNKTEACSGGTATCIKPALCEVCSGYHGEVDENAHVWREWAHVEGTETHKRVCDLSPRDHIEIVECKPATQKVVEPDCEAQGYTVNTCGTCGHEWKSDYVDALDHKWGAWEKGSAGWHQRTCEREGCTYGENGTAKVEESLCMYLQEVKEVVEPTCTEEGYTTYRCTGCGYEWNSFPVPATGHSYTKQTKKTESKYQRSTKDCVTDWTYWYCCDNCDVSAETEKDKYKNEADLYWVREAAAGHKFDAKTATDKYNATKATCTEKATYYYSCSVCEASSKGTANEKTFEHGTALNHDWQDTETYKKSEADCINNEVYYKECSRCHYSSQNLGDETWTKPNTLSGHDFKDGYTEGVAATCTESGVVEHYTCNVCKKHFKADKTTEIAADKLVIPALRHNYKEVAAKDATCEENGNKYHKQCQRCGYRNVADWEIPAIGHEFKAENGYYTDTVYNYHAYKCSNCDAYGVDKVKYSVDTTGLDPEIVGGIKCEFTGEYVNYDDENGIHSHKLSCVCGNETSAVCADADPKHEAPTCTENGYYVHTCDVCSFEWTVASDAEADKANGHDFEGVEWTQVAGKDEHTRRCKNCNETETEACATANPSTSCGSQNECDKCHQPFGEQIPHTWEEVKDEAYLKSAANCTDDAVYFKKCASCDNKDEKQIWVDEGSAFGHKMTEDYTYDLSAWDGMPEGFDTESIKKPTCHSEGLSITYCTNAGCDYHKTKSEKADSTAHVWPEEWTEVGGDCANGLTMVRKCTAEGCNAVQSKTEKVPHSWDEIVRVEADCTHAGYSHYKCTACGFVQIVDEAYELLDEEGNVVEEYPTFNGKDTGHKAALGHDYSAEMVVEKAATCGKDGRGYHVCQRCNEAGDKEVIPATGHDWDKNNDGITDEGFVPSMIDAKTTLYVEPVESTCQIDGHNGYYKCFNCSYDQSTFENWKKDNFFGKAEHADDNNDGKCDECNSQFYGEDNEKNCGCICHKEGWFMKFIYKIIRFFWKLFGIGKACECGATHY